MGYYSDGIYGIDESTLIMHRGTVHNRIMAYKEIIETLQALLDGDIENIQTIISNEKDSFMENYKSEDGTIRKSIITDFSDIIKEVEELISAINEITTEASIRKAWYSSLKDNIIIADSNWPINAESTDNSTGAILLELLPGKSKNEDIKKRQKNTRFNIKGTSVEWYVK